MSTEPNKPQSPAAIRQRHLDKLDYLGMFGNLTSLVSTLAYLMEEFIKEKLPPVVRKITLGFVAAGIVSVFASVFYKLKANRIPIDNLQTATQPAPASVASEAITTLPLASQTKNWVADTQARAEPAQAHLL